MNHPSRLLVALLFTVGATLAFAAQDHSAHAKAPAPAADNAAWLTKAKADYPLKTCVVSDEAIGSMGEGINHVYKQEGQPDRLVRFCCKSCLKDFNKDPAKYLKAIDDAAAKHTHQH